MEARINRKLIALLQVNEKLPSEAPGHVTHDAKVMVESFGVKK